MEKKDKKSMKQENLENVAGGFNFEDFTKGVSKGLNIVKGAASTLDSAINSLSKKIGNKDKTVDKAESGLGLVK